MVHVTARTPGQVAYEAFGAARWPGDPGMVTAWTHPAVDAARASWEAGAQAVLNDAFPGLRKELDDTRAAFKRLARNIEMLAPRETARTMIAQALSGDRAAQAEDGS